MERITKIGMMFFFMLFLVAPVFAQEEVEEVAVPDEDVILTEELDEGVVTGEVISLNVDSSTITVKADDGVEKTFSVIDEETILWKGIDDIELSDIKEGEDAEVGYYTDESGARIASWVDVLIEEEIAPLEEQSQDLGLEIESEVETDSQE